MDIDQIHQDIRRLYDKCEASGTDVPPPLVAFDFASTAREYIHGATVLAAEAGTPLSRPIVQLTGHAIECALKCYISAAGTKPHGHDLVALCKKAFELGYSFDERDVAAIAHLSHMYFEDLKTGTRYKARYTAQKDEPSSGTVPPTTWFAQQVDALIRATRDVVPELYRSMFSSTS